MCWPVLLLLLWLPICGRFRRVTSAMKKRRILAQVKWNMRITSVSIIACFLMSLIHAIALFSARRWLPFRIMLSRLISWKARCHQSLHMQVTIQSVFAQLANSAPYSWIATTVFYWPHRVFSMMLAWLISISPLAVIMRRSWSVTRRLSIFICRMKSVVSRRVSRPEVPQWSIQCWVQRQCWTCSMRSMWNTAVLLRLSVTRSMHLAMHGLSVKSNGHAIPMKRCKR